MLQTPVLVPGAVSLKVNLHPFTGIAVSAVSFLYGMDMINLNNVHLNWWYVAGSLLMIVSFLLVVSEHAHKLLEKKKLFD